VDQAVASGGSYEVLAKRLDGQGHALETLARQLNEERLEEFGRSQMEVIGRMRVRTENNCLGRDIAQVGGYLLFGYNVFMGLKQSTRVEDVFGLYRLHEGEQGYEVTPVDLKDIFAAESNEASRVHPMQVWRTPFASDDYAARQPQRDSFLGRIGNAELVSGISDALTQLGQLRGQLMATRDLRYVDQAAIDTMVQGVNEAQADVSQRTAAFIATDEAMQPYADQLQALDQAAQAAATVAQINEPLARMADMAAALDMLSELMGSLSIDDATQRTQVVDRISAVYARLNQVRARAEQRRSGLGGAENVAQFAAQLALFSQSIVSALGLAQTPEKCDEQLARLLVQLEEIESRFGEHEQFLGDIMATPVPTTCAASAFAWSCPATRTPSRARSSRSPTCWPTAPTSTTWATCSAACRRCSSSATSKTA
jgi:hypothetical protein